MPAGFRYIPLLSFDKHSDLWLRSISEPEKQLNGRRFECIRGAGWRGGSIVNAMGFARGQPEDFDHWAKNEFCTDLWSFEKCLPYFKRLESYTSGIEEADAIDYNAEIECMKRMPEYRGFDGPMKVFKMSIQSGVHSGWNSSGPQVLVQSGY